MDEEQRKEFIKFVEDNKDKDGLTSEKLVIEKYGESDFDYAMVVGWIFQPILGKVRVV